MAALVDRGAELDQAVFAGLDLRSDVIELFGALIECRERGEDVGVRLLPLVLVPDMEEAC